MKRLSLIILIVLGGPHLANTQPLAYDFLGTLPVVAYTLEIDAADLSSYRVEMTISQVPNTFQVAMVKHPEYDDKYWRYLQDLRVESKNGPGSVTREDSARWRIVTPGGE